MSIFDTSGPMPRNPWHGIDEWKEFKHDVSHPKESFIRFIYGLKGKNPLVPPEVRLIGIGLLFVGLANVIMGIVMILIASGLV